MADFETKKINELTEAAEVEDSDLTVTGDPGTGLLKKISFKNLILSIKDRLLGNTSEIADMGDGTVTGAITQLKSDISDTQEITAKAFSEEESYSIGDVCIYENKMYKFKENKEAGEWDEEIVEAILVKDLLDQKNDLVSDAFDKTKAYAEGDFCIYDNTLYKFKEEKGAGEWDEDAVEKVNITTALNSALAVNWQSAELTSDFTEYTSGSTPEYCKIAGVVYVQGIITPRSTLSGSSNRVEIFTLPSGYLPPYDMIYICQGSGTYRWALSITSGGIVAFSRYANGSSLADAASGTWLPFSVSFVANK